MIATGKIIGGQGSAETQQIKHEDRIERLNAVFYIRWTSGPDYERAFLCVEDGEPDMNSFAATSFGCARIFAAGMKALSAITNPEAPLAGDPICVNCATQEHGSPPLPKNCTCGDYPPDAQTEPKYCQCNSLTNPCIVCGKPKFIDRKWLKRKIEEDGEEGEIGAGFELFPGAQTEVEK